MVAVVYTPSVSIVTPAFNARCFITEAIESVLAQTHPDLEMLVVDDCSRDDTAQIVEQFARRESRIKLFRHVKNRGPAGARNTALAAATGRYIAFLDSDDIWVSSKLQLQISFMERNGAAISFTQYQRISEFGKPLGAIVPIPARLDYRGLLKNTAILTSTVMVDRAKVGPFRMKDTFYDDYALWLELLRRGFVAHGLDRDVVRYRIVGGSWSRNKLRSMERTWRIYRDVEKLDLCTAAWCFGNYAWNAYRKHRYGADFLLGWRLSSGR